MDELKPVEMKNQSEAGKELAGVTTERAAETADLQSGLLPCPFCGSHAHVRYSHVSASRLLVYWVECVICEIGTKYHDSKKGAAATWNTRITQSTKSSEASYNPERGQHSPASLPESGSESLSLSPPVGEPLAKAVMPNYDPLGLRPVGEGEAAERIWVRYNGLAGTTFSAAVERVTAPAVQPDEDSDLWGKEIEYRRVTAPPDLAQPAATLPCAGYEGCRTLEGVMYDFFVHDPACPKSPEEIEQSKLRDHAQLSREIAEKLEQGGYLAIIKSTDMFEVGRLIEQSLAKAGRDKETKL